MHIHIRTVCMQHKYVPRGHTHTHTHTHTHIIYKRSRRSQQTSFESKEEEIYARRYATVPLSCLYVMDDVTADFVCVIHVDCKHLIRSDPCRVLLGGLANGVLAFAGVLVESNQIK